MTTTTTRPKPRAHATPHPSSGCATCLDYLADRFGVLMPQFVRISTVLGTSVQHELETYMGKVHARHQAGEPIDYPNPARRVSGVDAVDGPTTLANARPSRPCRKCRARKRRRPTGHRHGALIGEVQ